MKKLLLILLALALSCAPAFAAASAQQAISGGKTAEMVFLDKGSARALITLGEDSVAKDMSFDDHIAAAEKSGGLLLSINGTYFNSYYKTDRALAYPDNCALIQQTLMMDGEVVVGGGDGRKMTLGVTADGGFIISSVAIKPYARINGQNYYFWGVNRYFSDDYSVELVTDRLGYDAALPAGAVVLWVRNGVIESIDSPASLSVPAGYKAIVFHKSMWESALVWNDIKAGDAAEILTEFDLADEADRNVWERVVTAVAGDPPLVSNGKNAASDTTNTDAKLAADRVLQRSFAAVLKDGRAVFGTVNASPNALADYLISIGAEDAVCLDGGASSALQAGGKKLTSPGRKLANVLHMVAIPAGSDAGGAPQAESAQIFTDVPLNFWAAPYINEAFADGVIEGTSYDPLSGARTFAPRSTLSFAQLATILLRAYYGDEYRALEGSGVKWSDAAYQLTEKYGLWNHPVDKDVFLKGISRCDMASLMVNIIKDRTGISVTESEKADAAAKIPDIDEVPLQYRDDILTAYALRLLSGYDDGSFGGSRTMNRAQAATIYCNMKALGR